MGRADDLRRAAEALARTRLLTLTGPGGTGKTRLSLRLAAQALDAYPGGAWLVEPAPLASGDLVAPTLAAVLGVPRIAHRSTPSWNAWAASRRSSCWTTAST